MAVISVTITASVDQVVAGIPKTISITANVSATIFYTLDGSTPTLFSTIYTGPIYIPYNLSAGQLSTTLSVLATNGTDSSPIITEVYQTDAVDGNVRFSHSGTTAQAGSWIPDPYPFGTNEPQPNQQYTAVGDAGVNVYDQTLPATPTGFDGAGNPTGYTNEPYDITNYQIVYGNRDANGDTIVGLIGNGKIGYGIGNLPGITTVERAPADYGPEETNQFTTTFNPRALVIFQDFSKEDPGDPPQINGQFISLEDPNTARDGAYYSTTARDGGLSVSGSFVRSEYNPRTNEMTYYYRDAWSNRWIISTAPYQPGANGTESNLAQPVWGGVGGSQYVYEFIPFARRYLG